MPLDGWIKLHRQIQEHWLWQSKKPFDKRSAWIDLLLLANHEDNKVLLGNELITIKRGEHVTSERKLAERWGWSKTKVRRFLKILENDSMILVQKPNQKRTSIKLLHYSDYQDRENQKKTIKKPEENHKKTTEKPEKNLNKNVKNDKNEKNKDIVLQIKIGEIYNSIPDDDWLELFRNYINIYRLKNKTREITPNRHYNLLKELYQIFSGMKFTFDQQEYEINKVIFKRGIEEIINKEVDNLNYAKKVWISEKEKEKKAKKPVKERPREELEKDGYI
jgi:hypothetical protein